MPTKQSMIQAKYDAKNCKTYSLKFNRKTDAEIIEKLDIVESRNGYIKELIRKDIICPGSVPVSAPDTIPVKLSRSVQESLEEQAKIQGISVPDIITAIVSEAAIRYEMHK